MSSAGSRAKEAFLEALDLTAAERARHLDELARSAPDLARAVRELFAAHDGGAAGALEEVSVAHRAALGGLGGRARAPGYRLGDYELLEEVGEGAFGSVWRARQVSLDRIVALKFLRSGRFAGARDQERLRAEAEAVARLDHPHIVPIYEVGEADGVAYFSMKWIEGGSLAGRMGTPWPPRRAALLMRDVARAVHHAHQRGLLHRDLKPSNVLLDADGDPHVADFGIAKRLDGPAGATTTNTLAGTPAYMAPEQADGGELTVATDVWALGCMLHELLAARPAFAGATVAETLRRVRDAAPTRLRELHGDVPRDLETITLACLRKDPAARYSSASTLADDLERWLELEPIAARRTSAVERLQLFCRRSPLAATLIGMVAALLLLLAGGASWASFELGVRLREAYLGEARATRLSAQPGARARSLELLSRAAAIRDGEDLRNEAIACLALSDVVLERSIPRDEGDLRIVMDRALERSFFTTGRDSTVVGADGTLVARLPLEHEVGWAHWSRDGRWLLVKTTEDSQVFETQGYASKLSVAGIYNRSADFRPRGGELAYVTEGAELVFAGLEENSVRRRVSVWAPSDALAYAPDGLEIALLSSKPRTRIEFRDVEDGALLREVACEASPYQIVWFGSGSEFAVACEDARIRLYRAGAAGPHAVLDGHSAEVVELFSAPGSDLLASYSWDETTKLWDALTQRELVTLSARAVGLGVGGRRLVTLDSRSWSSWSVEHGSVLRGARAHSGKAPHAIAIASDGVTVASAGWDGLYTWASRSATPPRQVSDLDLRSVAFTGPGLEVVAGGPGGVWRIALDRPDPPARVTDLEVYDLVVMTDGRTLAALARDAVHLVPLAPGGRSDTFRGEPYLECLSVSTDGARAAAGNWRGNGVHVWELGGSAPPRVFFPGKRSIRTALSPDGLLLATTTGDRFELLRVADGATLASIERRRAFGLLAGPLTFSPDGRRIAFGLSGDTVRVLDIRSLAPWGDLLGPTSDVVSDLAFSPDGTRLAASCSTRLVEVWDLEALERSLGEDRSGFDVSSR